MAMPDAMLSSLLQTMPSLELSSNDPIDVPAGSKATGPTTQTTSLLQVRNLSGSYILTYFISDGTAEFSETGSIKPAPASLQWMRNFNGAGLVVANLSVFDATMQVTLIEG